MNPDDAKRWISTSPATPRPPTDGVMAFRNHDGDYYCTECVGRIVASGKEERTLRLIPILDKSPTWWALRGTLWCDCCENKFK
jgi:hypothetical protein